MINNIFLVILLTTSLSHYFSIFDYIIFFLKYNAPYAIVKWSYNYFNMNMTAKMHLDLP